MPVRNFHASRRFHPGYSWLGRWLRRRTGDRLRAEALHILWMTGAGLGGLTLIYLGGTVLQPVWTAHPTAAVAYGAGLVLLTLVIAPLGLLGWCPALTVSLDETTLHLTQGPRTMTLPLDDVQDVACISAVRYHRHERRYTGTVLFIGRLGETVLRARTKRQVVIIALPEAEVRALHALLETAHPAMRTENAVL